MSHNNANMTGQLPLNFSSNGGDEYLKEKRDAIWKHWFEVGLWDYKYAIRLSVCGPCNAIRTCTEHCEKGVRELNDSYPDDKYDCFHSKLSDANDPMSAFFDLYESEMWSQYGFPNDEAPDRIPPAKFIEWALSKKSITIPQDMEGWFASRPKKNSLLTQGGSNAETDKILATQNACGRVIETIYNGDRTRFGSDGFIGEKEFIEQVRDTMKADGNHNEFQTTAAKKGFRSSERLKLFKRPRGRKPNSTNKK